MYTSSESVPHRLMVAVGKVLKLFGKIKIYFHRTFCLFIAKKKSQSGIAIGSWCRVCSNGKVCALPLAGIAGNKWTPTLTFVFL